VTHLIFDGEINTRGCIYNNRNDVLLNQSNYSEKDIQVLILIKEQKEQILQDKYSRKKFSAFFFKDEHFYVCLHGACKTERCLKQDERHSEVVKLDLGFNVKQRWPSVGCGNHNVYVENGKIYTLNSVFSTIMEIDEETDKRREINIANLGGEKLYLRGLARNDKYFYVGAAEHASRDKRSFIKSYILAFDSDFNFIERFDIPDMHHIRDIRLYNQIDRAHNGIMLCLN